MDDDGVRAEVALDLERSRKYLYRSDRSVAKAGGIVRRLSKMLSAIIISAYVKASSRVVFHLKGCLVCPAPAFTIRRRASSVAIRVCHNDHKFLGAFRLAGAEELCRKNP